MEKALSSLKKYKIPCILGPIFKMVEVIFELITPFIMRFIINVGINEAIYDKNYFNIIFYSILLLLLAVLGFSSTIVCQYFASITTWGVGEDIRNRLYKKVSSFSSNELNKFGSNYLITTISNDVIKLQNGVSMAIRLALRAPCLVIGALICSFIIKWQIGLIYLGLIPLICIIYFIVFKFSSKQILKMQEKNDKITEICKDSFNGMRFIKGFNKEENVINEFEKATDEYYKESKRNSILNSIINPFTFFIVNIAVILIVYISTNYIFVDNNLSFITSGDLVALISYLNQILLALIVVCNLIVIFTKAYASNKRINKVLSVEPTIKNGNIFNDYQDLNYDYIFKLENVSFSFSEDKHNVLQDINLEIKKGEKIGIIGLTGSGKSTLLKLLNRLIDAKNGKVFFKDKNIKEYDLNYLKDNVSIVNQKSILFKGNLHSNLTLENPSIDENKIINALKVAQAYDFVRNYSDFLKHNVEENGSNFSGGQKQRLSIARSLLKEPEVLILDDSTSALDAITEKKLLKELFNLKDLTLIIVSQKISALINLDRIYVLDHGKIVDVGKHDDLLVNSKIYRDIYNSQFGRNE